MDANIIDEFTEERTQHKMPAGAAMSPATLAAVQAITPAQSAALALMSYGEKCAVLRRALELDQHAAVKMPDELREQAHEWLRFMGHVDAVATVMGAGEVHP